MDENRKPGVPPTGDSVVPETKPQPKEPLGMFGLLMAKDGLQFALDHLVNAGKIIKASKVREAENAEREARVGAKRVRRALDIVARAIEKGVRPKEPPTPVAGEGEK